MSARARREGSLSPHGAGQCRDGGHAVAVAAENLPQAERRSCDGAGERFGEVAAADDDDGTDHGSDID